MAAFITCVLVIMFVFGVIFVTDDLLKGKNDD